jgi:hypothetical protein
MLFVIKKEKTTEKLLPCGVRHLPPFKMAFQHVLVSVKRSVRGTTLPTPKYNINQYKIPLSHNNFVHLV